MAKKVWTAKARAEFAARMAKYRGKGKAKRATKRNPLEQPGENATVIQTAGGPTIFKPVDYKGRRFSNFYARKDAGRKGWFVFGRGEEYGGSLISMVAWPQRNLKGYQFPSGWRSKGIASMVAAELNGEPSPVVRRTRKNPTAKKPVRESRSEYSANRDLAATDNRKMIARMGVGEYTDYMARVGGKPRKTRRNPARTKIRRHGWVIAGRPADVEGSLFHWTGLAFSATGKPAIFATDKGAAAAAHMLLKMFPKVLRDWNVWVKKL